jgi:hypothetical protein
MKSKLTDTDQRYLLLFKLDARSLFERIHDRMHEYVEVFALKRDRRHFDEIFRNRYERATVRDLSHCPMEIIESLDQFYKHASDMYWYLRHTEDMPNTVEDELTRKAARLKKLYETLALYIDAELSGIRPEDEDFRVMSDDEHVDELSSELGVQSEDRYSVDIDTDL